MADPTDLAATIAARRQRIEDSAPCDCCGATLAACKAERGKDPTAPPWFGCCARPLLDDDRCHHVPNAGALLTLLNEIETGEVRTVEDATRKPERKGMPWSEYLDQAERWQPNGRPMVPIGDMDLPWRYNASRWLERKARIIAALYTGDEQLWFDAECASPFGPSDTSADMIRGDLTARADGRAVDPLGWIRGTNLYRALVADLPDCSAALSAIADLARHWSTCPARAGVGACRCEDLRAQREADLGLSPDWTI